MRILEIIETYWNVNLCFTVSLWSEPHEIIETYWNVNALCYC